MAKRLRLGRDYHGWAYWRYDNASLMAPYEGTRREAVAMHGSLTSEVRGEWVRVRRRDDGHFQVID